jgi:DNA-binding MarR family transcriptional regulator
MNALTELAIDLAQMHEALANRLRLFTKDLEGELSRRAEVQFADRVVSAARRLHASVGPRQLEALRLIAVSHPAGIGTGNLMKRMQIDQPNVYLTLKSLVERGFLRKEGSSSPHLYFLSDKLTAEAGGADN